MKRLAAILFLLVLVFNLYGYRFLFSYLQNQQAVALEKQVDHRQYDENNLVSIKTKLHLPYYTSAPEFERAYGSVNIGGTEYEYVKRRVHNDTLELLCLPNEGKTALQSLKNSLAKAGADETSTAPVKKAPSFVKISLPDFFQAFAQGALPSTGGCLHHHSFLNRAAVFSGYSSAKDKPPQSLSLVS